jgi:hypothetical protein
MRAFKTTFKESHFWLFLWISRLGLGAARGQEVALISTKIL